MSTQHPHSSKVQLVIDALERALPLAVREDHLDMTETEVCNTNHFCGTVHCHGGWFAIGYGLVNDNEVRVNYSDGVCKMLEVLGFNEDDGFWPNDLCDWADENKAIWGNDMGMSMFSSRKAFISPSRPSGALNLQHIIDHWCEVRDRLKALENEQQPATDPYSLSVAKKLAVEALVDKREQEFVNEIVNN